MSTVQLVDNEVWNSDTTDVSDIERALRRLRLAVRSDEDEGVPAAVTDAAVLNLAVCATERALLDEAADAIRELSQRHPSRSIFFLRQPESEDRLSGQVNAFCTFIPGSDRQICCEQVEIVAGGSYAAQMHSILPSLLVPDVPLFVWWRGQPPLKSEMYRRVRELATRMTVNSSGFKDAFGELANQVQQCAEDRCAISDLAWSRLAGWRDQIARLFDPPDSRRYAWRLDSVVLEATCEDYPTESVLVAGWLAGQLGWVVAEPLVKANRGWRGGFTSQDRDVSLAINCVQPAQDPGLRGLRGVLLGAESTSFQLSVGADGSCLLPQVRFQGNTVSHGALAIQRPTLLQLLSAELELTANDPVYERAIGIAAELVGG